jgi:hypothetical protein
LGSSTVRTDVFVDRRHARVVALRPFERVVRLNLWTFHPEDEHLLRHLPDIIVRPGGPDVGAAARSPLPAD